MARYALFVDGKRRARAASVDGVRAWLRDYQVEHAEDDPRAAHVQLLELRPFAWIRGGRVLDPQHFL